MITNAQARALGHSFNFSPEQWPAIVRAVDEGCRLPSFFDTEFLLQTVNDYRSDRDPYIAPAVRAAPYKKAARRLRQAAAALSAAERNGLLFSYMEDSDENVEYLFFKRSGNPEPNGRPCFEERPLRGWDVVSILEQWAQCADDCAGRSGAPIFESERKKLIPSLLWLWIRSGGYIRYSRASPTSSRPGTLTGPLIRFLDAILVPVMGADAPSGESIRKKIDKFASDFERKLTNPEHAAYREATLLGKMGKGGFADPYAFMALLDQHPQPSKKRARLLTRGPPLNCKKSR